jgi:hypothetical protein
MARAEMSRTQRLATTLLPWWAAAMEAESREWRTSCPCGHEFSVWDAGGVRFKASGTPTVVMRCPSCGRAARMTVARRP